jgi:hypothetical protein
MGKKITRLVVVFVVLFNILVSSFLEVEAKSNATQQPEVCS